MRSGKLKLREWVNCPHCWNRFRPRDCLFIACHDSLRGDVVLGPDEYIRFRPSRFAVDGQAIDPLGVECRDVACPRCHLQIARALLEFPPVTISLVGAPASSKSYYLAAMTYQLRRLLPQLGWTLADADPAANAILHEQEQTLFMSSAPDRPVRLDKTDVAGSRLYHSVTVDGQVLTLPKPFQFTLTSHQKSRGRGHVLILYDNAGEHFLPGHESMQAPVTEHLAHSDVVFFMLDPTQDPRIRTHIRATAGKTSDENRMAEDLGAVRQELVLNETIVRIRKARGLSTGAKHKALLMVVLVKADVWQPLLGRDLEGAEPLCPDPVGGHRFDFNAIGYASRDCRTMLERVSPEVVSLAEASFHRVVYVPVSATGGQAEQFEVGERMMDGYRPRNIRPQWTLAPIACALGYVEPNLAPQPPAEAKRKRGGS